MQIEYKWTRLSPVLDQDGTVVSWIVELSARDLELPELGWARIDGTITAEPRKPLSEWTQEEVIALAEKHAKAKPETPPSEEGGTLTRPRTLNWYEQLEAQLKSILQTPVVGQSLIPEPPRPIEAEIARIDKETELAINRAMHPMAEYGEQIGILREQIVHILNTLGLEPTPEFQRLHETAIAEIEKGQMKKEALYAQDNQA